MDAAQTLPDFIRSNNAPVKNIALILQFAKAGTKGAKAWKRRTTKNKYNKAQSKHPDGEGSLVYIKKQVKRSQTYTLVSFIAPFNVTFEKDSKNWDYR